MQRQTSLAAIVCAVFLVMAACSSSSPATEHASPSSDGPLFDALNAIYAVQGDPEVALWQMEVLREELIAECMVKEGFEYTPNPQSEIVIPQEPWANGLEPGSLEYRQQFGYGMIQSRMEGVQEFSNVSPGQVDPNEAYLRSLTASEKRAFNEALWGPVYEGQPYDDSIASSPISGSDSKGCYNWATNHEEMRRFNPEALFQDPEFADLDEAFLTLDQQIQEQPEIVKLNQEWSDCMADEGHPALTKPASFDEGFRADLLAIENWDALSAEQIEDLQEREISEAVAELGCIEKVDFWDRYRETSFRVQQEIVDRFGDLLQAATLKYGSGSK